MIHRVANSGFTLLEMLVVLVLAALLTGIVLPRLYQMTQNMEVTAQKAEIVEAVEGLGYLAYRTGKPFRLQTVDHQRKIAESELTLPEGWTLQLSKSIDYRSDGKCSGGELQMVAPDGRVEEYRLNPPLCRMEQQHDVDD